MVYSFLFVFGLAIGSFINVVVYRLNHGKNPLIGRSFCPQCKHQLAWFDNIPLLSFALLRGRCRYCDKKISWQYPLVELATGILTIIIYYLSFIIYHFNFLVAIYYLLITYALIAIFVSDFLYETIPDEISYPGMIISGIAAISGISGVSGISGILAGLGAASFFLFLNLATRGRGMGMGDIKLAGLMGLVLGYPKIIVALMLAFLTGALVGVILILLSRKRFGEHLPFGPFLAAAAWLSLFWGDKIIAFYFSFL